MVDPQHVVESYALEATFLLPLFGTAVFFLGGFTRRSERWPALLAIAIAACSLPLSIIASLATRNGGSVSMLGGEWIPGFGPALSFYLDWLSSWLLLLVDIVGLMVVIFSRGYMAAEGDQRRFFGGLLFFITSMKLLLLAGSYLLLFAGWEGVGLASYVLIGYHFERPLAAKAATKAFIVNRIGDAGFILAIIALALTCGSTNFTTVRLQASAIGHGTLVLAASLLVVAAVGKSAQLPLHVWLPDAMEGPTPVSALIHSATMVCAGVYLLARSSQILVLAPEVGIGVSILGAVTALFGASVAIVENDIKRVLAYSTISQIGFMFLALGLGAARAGMFHVVTHAFFKSLLFLGAGSVIHALHGEQNLTHMGGLRKKLPITFWTMCIGVLTLAGVPGFSAFLSKDLILEAGFTSGHSVLALCGVITSFLTAFYGWRLLSLAFFGHGRTHQLEPHEGPPSMRIPLIVLAVCCVLAGPLFVPVHWAAWPTMLLSAILATLGIVAAWHFYISQPGSRAALDERFAPVTKLLRNRWYIDAVYEEHLVEGLVMRTAEGACAADSAIIDRLVVGISWLSRKTAVSSNWFDGSVIDRSVQALSLLTRFASWPLRSFQTGFVQTYALYLVAGVLVVLALCLLR